ncbi:MAG: DUF3106 domain-containing protein [Burkholderiales bacterium]|uniref:DUF3106 domain-containing protein n=1 Tax=Ottowia pentelensis TaxID=511108 RepID=A0ABV6PVE3_9BURK|nr:DUF3106 domain-containing protein [Ottowia sp.]MBN9404359.1 DUF3106 domain-containing protein [Burkholderiales bacterium]MBS0401288.1 DUF3106 domain-containing protein [Pseudomonadota bacterium]MBS0412956.1 DUF3106 domain-containing protein [Pseudomonadota bacterium]
MPARIRPTRWLAALLVPIGLTLALAAPAQAESGARPARAARPAHAAASNGIAWRELTARQKTALAPLKEQWPTLSAEHQRKWIALARNYHRLSPAEQATLQRRMSDWAQLSPSQRTRARLNFGEARRLPADEKRAQWEAYQALPEQERERLAQDRPKPPVTAAPALRPAPPSAIARPLLPATRPADGGTRDIRSSVPLNRHTLLPLRTAPDTVDRR